jgi:metallo-beta-lactamase family protein
LYDARLAKEAIACIVAVPVGRRIGVGALKVEFTPVGHLLGAMAVTVSGHGLSLAFSGDLGRDDDLLMPAPQPIAGADVLLVESTYGNRLHPRENVQARLRDIVRETVQRGGSVLLPSFAVGRAQALLLVFQRLRRSGELPTDLPIFLDSPMAQTATALCLRHRKLLRIAAAEANSLMGGVRHVETSAQSQRLAASRWPRIVISASGMATGGRVLHHLKAMASDARNHFVFPGFQVPGTRGARLIAGASEVKIHGEYVKVKAQVSHLEGFSGHADADGILRWLRAMRTAPRHTFVVHGDPEAADTLRLRIQDDLGWRVSVPSHDSVFEA